MLIYFWVWLEGIFQIDFLKLIKEPSDKNLQPIILIGSSHLISSLSYYTLKTALSVFLLRLSKNLRFRESIPPDSYSLPIWFLDSFVIFRQLLRNLLLCGDFLEDYFELHVLPPSPSTS